MLASSNGTGFRIILIQGKIIIMSWKYASAMKDILDMIKIKYHCSFMLCPYRVSLVANCK